MSAQFAFTKQFWTGFLYTAIGGIALVIARDYQLGTLARMGPAYFPTALASLLVLIGVACMVRGVVNGGDRLERFGWRSLVFVTLAICVFGYFLPLLGLPIALILMIGVGSLASRRVSFDPGFILAMVFFVACCIGLFIYGLGLAMPLFGSLLEGFGL